MSDLWGWHLAADSPKDEWGNYAHDGDYRYPDEDVDLHMNGSCWEWALAHQKLHPHLRIGQEWAWVPPEERDEPDEEWEAKHAFTHDNHWAYDVRGAFPLSEWQKWKGWDDVTFNHDPREIGGSPDWPSPDDAAHALAQRNKLREPLPDTPQMVNRDGGWHVAMAWGDWAPKIQPDSFEEHGVTPPPCVPGKCSYDRENASGYRIMHDGNGRSGISYGHYRDDNGQPYIGIIGVSTDEGHRHDGVAEALIRRVHQDHPGIAINPGWMTDMGQAFHDRMLEKEPTARDVVTARIAMPAPLPQGVYFRYHPELMWSPGVTAHLPGGKQVGSLEWYDDDHVMVDLGTRRPGEIDRISVAPEHQGNSIATSMFDFAKQYEPRLHHSDQLTEDGRGWSEYEKARNAVTAGRNGPLPDGLTFKYHPEEGHGTDLHPKFNVNNAGGQFPIDLPAVTAHLGDDPTPVGYLSWFRGHPDEYRQEQLEQADEGMTLDDLGLSNFGEPIGSGPNDEDYIGWPGSISNIQVADKYQRQGIGLAMFDYAKAHHRPDLHHSNELTYDGYEFSQAEKRRHKAMAVLPDGHEGPAEPHFDPHHWYDPADDTPTPEDATWYHVSPHKLKPGAVLTPSGGESLFEEDGFYDNPGVAARKRWVWMDHDLDEIHSWMDELFNAHLRSYATHPAYWPEDEQNSKEPPLYVYRIQPHHPPKRWNSDSNQGWVSGSATVLGTEMKETGPWYDRVRKQVKPKKSLVARAPWNPAGGPLWRGMRVKWSPEELVRLHDLHDSGDHETLAHTILDKVQHGSTVGEWHMPREDGGGLGVFWSGSPEVSQGYGQHGDGHNPDPAKPFEKVVVQTGGYDPDDEWTPYDEDVPHDWEPNDFLNEDRETDLYPGASLGITHVHVNGPGGPLAIPLSRPRQMTAGLLTALDWHSHDSEQQRLQLKDKIPADLTFLEPTDDYPVLLRSEDDDEGDLSWDDWVEGVQSSDYNPTPRAGDYENPPKQQTWYHISPHEMNPGDQIIPGHRESRDNPSNGGYVKYTPPGGGPFNPDKRTNPLGLPPHDNSNQAKYVWMVPRLAPAPGEQAGYNGIKPLEYASWWSRHLSVPHINNGQVHVYEVRPTEHPKPWNLYPSEGWVASGARVVRRVPDEEWNPTNPKRWLNANTKQGLLYFLGLDWHSHTPEQQRLQVKDKIPADPSFLEPTDANWLEPEVPDEIWGTEEADDWYLKQLEDPDYDPTPTTGFYANPPKQQRWYHVSPHEMKPGDQLIPLKNESYDNNKDYRKYTPIGGGEPNLDEWDNPLKLPAYDNHTQARYVWMSPKLRPDPADYDDLKDKIQYANNDVTPEEDEARRQKWFWDGNESDAKWWANRLKRPNINNGQMHVYEVRPTEHPKPWNGTTGNGWAAPGARVIRKVPVEEWQVPPNGAELIEQARQRKKKARLAGMNGSLPPLTFEPFNTMWSNGIMARHAEDGRPVGHLHWYPNGEIDAVIVHPQLQRRGIASAMLKHAQENPDRYPSTYPIFHSEHLTSAGRAWAAADGHNLPDDQVHEVNGDPDTWGYTAVARYVPMHVPYNGQNEDEMSNNLEQPWTPPLSKISSVSEEGWPVWWNGKHRPAGDFDNRWGPNHPQHIPAPWEI